MKKDKSTVISNITSLLLEGNETASKAVLQQEYPHTQAEIEKRAYTMAQKMNQFISDGFIDRYSGQKLLNPGILKILSHYFPEDFPYHPHWKMTNTHIAYACGSEPVAMSRQPISIVQNTITANAKIHEGKLT